MRWKLQRSRNSSYYLYLQRMALKPGFKETLGITLSLITVSFFLIFALKPSLTKIASLKKSIEASQQTLDQLKKKKTALVGVERLWSQIKDENKRVEKTIPLGPDYNYFVKEVEWVAQTTGVKYANGSFSASLIKSDLINAYEINQHLAPIEIKVNLRFEGDYPNLMETLDKLTELDRLLEIKSVTINQNDNKSETGRLVMTVGGKIYYFGDKTKIENILKPVKRRH